MQQQGNYNLLIDKINLFTRKYYLNNLLRGLIFLGAGLFSAYVVITLSEYFGNFNTLARTLLFYAFILLNLGLLVWLVMPSLLAYLKLGKTLSHHEAAEIIGTHFPGVSDKLLNTLQLKKQADEDDRGRQLIEASIDQKIALLKPVSFPSAVNLKENNRYLKWLILPVAIICIIAFAAPSVLTESTKRLINHNQYYAPLAPFKFEVLNKNLAAVQGEDVKLQIKLSGDKIPADVYVETANNTFKLDKENLTRFHYVFANVQQNTTFRLSANGYYSEPYQIKVNLKPSLLHFDVALSYPAYLHKKDETVMNAGDLTIPAGTVVKWQLHTQNTDKVLFRLNDAQKDLTNATNGLFEHAERITRNGVYSLKPQNGLVTRGDSASYRINVIADETPSITVEEKADSVSTKALYFAGRVQDDHGFSNLTFHYRVSGQTEKQVTKAVKADLRGTQSDFFHFWDLKELNIKPGDQVFYYFDVADNDAVAGPKHARSPERSLTVPTEKELADQLNAGTKSVMDKMQSAMKMAAQVEREAQKLNQLLLNKNTLSFDEKKQVQDLINKKKELNELVKKMQEENKKNLYNRQENQKQDENLTEKQKQMDELLKNVLDPETEKLMEKLQQMLEQERKDSTREALNQMQNQNRDLKREMNRLQELYKQLQFDQQLDQTAKQLEKLAEEQNKLADKTQQQQAADKNELQKQQEKLNQDFKQVEKQMDELQKQNEQLDKKNNFQNSAQDKQEVEQQMNDSKEGIQKDERQKASKAQRQASQKMQQMAQKMKESNQEGEEKQNEVDAQQLRELLKSLVNSSFEQERVMQTLRNTNPGDPNYVTLAQKQKDIKDNLKTAQDTLFALSKRIQQIQSTVNTEVNSINDHIDKALENMGDRRTAEANRNQQFTMTSMNNLALMLNEALDNLQNQMSKSKGGKGKQQQSMQQLSKQQQQLNQNMQRMRNQMQQQGNNMSKSQHQSQSEQLARMARQQQQIRQDLQKLDQQQNKDGRGQIGDLQKIAKQMEQTENDLVNRRITDDALKRQQQIQTRLLEAEKAEQEREQDRQRNSNAGKELPPGYIKALQNYQQVRSKQTEQIKTVPAALNLYYKQKIKTYFDQLNAK